MLSCPCYSGKRLFPLKGIQRNSWFPRNSIIDMCNEYWRLFILLWSIAVQIILSAAHWLFLFVCQQAVSFYKVYIFSLRFAPIFNIWVLWTNLQKQVKCKNSLFAHNFWHGRLFFSYLFGLSSHFNIIANGTFE